MKGLLCFKRNFSRWIQICNQIFRHPQFLYNDIFLLLIFRNFRYFCQWYYYMWTNILNSFQQRVVTYNLPLSNRYVLRNRKWMKQTLSHGAVHSAESCRVMLHTRVGTLIVSTIYLQLIQNRYMFRNFTVLHCSHQHCVQPAASDVEVVGYL